MMRPTVDPHDSELLRPPVAEPAGLRPHDLGSSVSPPSPRDRVGRASGCFLCRHRRRRPRRSVAPPSLPARWAAVGARPRPRSSRLHPASVREPDRMLPPVLLGTSSRQAHASDPPNRPCRRRRRLDQLPGSTLRRRFRTTLSVGSDPAASEQAPTRWRPTRAETRAHRRNQATREALVRCRTPSTRCRHRAATRPLTRPGARGPPRGRTLAASRETARAGRHVIVPVGRDDVAIAASPPGAMDPKTHGDRRRLPARTVCAANLPPQCRTGTPRRTRPRRRADKSAGRSRWHCQVGRRGVAPMLPPRRRARRGMRSCATTTACWRGAFGDDARTDPRSALRQPRPLESAGWELGRGAPGATVHVRRLQNNLRARPANAPESGCLVTTA